MEFRFTRKEEPFRGTVRDNDEMGLGAPTKRGADIVGGNHCLS